MLKLAEMVAGLLLVLVFAYGGWRALLLGKKLQNKVHGEQELPTTSPFATDRYNDSNS